MSRRRSPARLPLRVHATGAFWAVLSVSWLLDDWGVLPCFLAAALLHELGHLAALQALGIPVYCLELRASGAVIRADLRQTPQELWAYAAGPGVNLLLGFALRRTLPGFALCNLALGLWNLLPAEGLDGGQLCALALPRLLGRAGEYLCKLLHLSVICSAAALGLWGSCVLRLGPLPLLLGGLFLLRLPKRTGQTAPRLIQ